MAGLLGWCVGRVGQPLDHRVCDQLGCGVIHPSGLAALNRFLQWIQQRRCDLQQNVYFSQVEQEIAVSVVKPEVHPQTYAQIPTTTWGDVTNRCQAATFSFKGKALLAQMQQDHILRRFWPALFTFTRPSHAERGSIHREGSRFLKSKL